MTTRKCLTYNAKKHLTFFDSHPSIRSSICPKADRLEADLRQYHLRCRDALGRRVGNRFDCRYEL